MKTHDWLVWLVPAWLVAGPLTIFLLGALGTRLIERLEERWHHNGGDR